MRWGPVAVTGQREKTESLSPEINQIHSRQTQKVGVFSVKSGLLLSSLDNRGGPVGVAGQREATTSPFRKSSLLITGSLSPEI